MDFDSNTFKSSVNDRNRKNLHEEEKEHHRRHHDIVVVEEKFSEKKNQIEKTFEYLL
jgi:hypothetical protein